MNYRKLTKQQKAAVAELVRAAKANDRQDMAAVFNEMADHADPAVGTEAQAQLADWINVQINSHKSLMRELREVEKRHRDVMNGIWLHLIDTGVDEENVSDAGYTPDSVGYWAALRSSAAMAAGQRAEEAGIELNKELGFTVY